MRGALTALLTMIAVVLVMISLPNLPAVSRNIMVVGVGTNSCGNWTKERRTKSVTSFEYGQWVLGYVSAINSHVLEHDAHVAKGIDNVGLLAWLDNYCKLHPLDTIDEAGSQLIIEVMKKTGAY
jgi:hypothetical protein